MLQLLLALQVLPDASADAGPLPWIDKTAVVLLAIFLVLGFWRGLWWQVIRMVGFVGAFAAARLFSPRVEPLLTETFKIEDERFSQGLAWLLIFIGALVVAVLLGKLGKKLLESLQLGMVDRVTGALAGAVTALLIHSALLAGMSLLAPADWLAESLEGSWSANLLELLGEEWPVIVDSKQGEWIQLQLQPGPAVL